MRKSNQEREQRKYQEKKGEGDRVLQHCTTQKRQMYLENGKFIISASCSD